MKKLIFNLLLLVVIFSCSGETEKNVAVLEQKVNQHQMESAVRLKDSITVSKVYFDSVINVLNILQSEYPILYEQYYQLKYPNQDTIATFNYMAETLYNISEVESDVEAPYEIHIDWSWDSYAAPSKILCAGFIITGDGRIPKAREVTSAHDCVVKAIQAYRNGYKSGAINWLRASQCHSRKAQMEIEQGGDAALEYMMSNYGNQVP